MRRVRIRETYSFSSHFQPQTLLRSGCTRQNLQGLRSYQATHTTHNYIVLDVKRVPQSPPRRGSPVPHPDLVSSQSHETRPALSVCNTPKVGRQPRYVFALILWAG